MKPACGPKLPGNSDKPVWQDSRGYESNHQAASSNVSEGACSDPTWNIGPSPLPVNSPSVQLRGRYQIENTCHSESAELGPNVRGDLYVQVHSCPLAGGARRNLSHERACLPRPSKMLHTSLAQWCVDSAHQWLGWHGFIASDEVAPREVGWFRWKSWSDGSPQT